MSHTLYPKKFEKGTESSSPRDGGARERPRVTPGLLHLKRREVPGEKGAVVGGQLLKKTATKSHCGCEHSSLGILVPIWKRFKEIPSFGPLGDTRWPGLRPTPVQAETQDSWGLFRTHVGGGGIKDSLCFGED